MNRKLLWLFTILILVVGTLAEAQQPKKVYRIGYLSPGFSSPTPARTEAFRQGLRELGYVEGQNIVIEYRFAEGKLGRLPGLVAELLRLNVDVIFAYGTPAIRVLKKAKTTIPVVTVSGDPVRNGFVTSLASPGGNITGLANITPELAGRLELLKEIVPQISRVAVIWNPDLPGSGLRMRETEAAARALGLKIQSLEVRGSNDLENAFSAIKIEQAGAVVPLRGRTTNNLQERIIELAKKDRVPTVYDSSVPTEAGAFEGGRSYAIQRGRPGDVNQPKHRASAKRDRTRHTSFESEVSIPRRTKSRGYREHIPSHKKGAC